MCTQIKLINYLGYLIEKQGLLTLTKPCLRNTLQASSHLILITILTEKYFHHHLCLKEYNQSSGISTTIGSPEMRQDWDPNPIHNDHKTHTLPSSLLLPSIRNQDNNAPQKVPKVTQMGGK